MVVCLFWLIGFAKQRGSLTGEQRRIHGVCQKDIFPCGSQKIA